MEFSSRLQGRETALIELFRSSFSAAEGPEEGRLISDLVQNLLTHTQPEDLFLCIAEENAELLGGCLFSRLTFEQDDRVVFILAPVAVASHRQRQGIGQTMLRHGLELLRNAGVDIVMTYGDPDYYARVGFVPVSQTDVIPPLPLKYPHGWLGQSLTKRQLSALKGPSRCVDALKDPAFW